MSVASYYRVAYRIRGWGTIPSTGVPKLLVANHQHEIESAVLVSDQNVRARTWRYPIFTISSRRMWEPGFFAERIPWLSPFLRSANVGWLFAALGMQPIENELAVRPFVSIAYALVGRHGDLPVDDVFLPVARKMLPASVKTLKDILAARHFRAGRLRVKLNDMSETYRKELLEMTRAEIESDLAHFELLQRSGATIFLTPEGSYTGDGKMQRFRGALSRLAPLSEIWLAGISYDPFVGRRLSMLYRVVPSAGDAPLEVQLKAVRPVTTSAVLGSWLYEHRETPFAREDARAAVRTGLEALPPALFVEPELRRAPGELTDRAVAGMLRLGVVREEGGALRVAERRVHPQFPRTRDILEYQFNFHGETLQGASALQGVVGR